MTRYDDEGCLPAVVASRAADLCARILWQAVKSIAMIAGVIPDSDVMEKFVPLVERLANRDWYVVHALGFRMAGF